MMRSVSGPGRAYGVAALWATQPRPSTGLSTAPAPSDFGATVRAARTPAVDRLIRTLETAGYGSAANAALAVYAAEFWRPGLNQARQLAFFYDALVVTQAPWPALEITQDVLPVGWGADTIMRSAGLGVRDEAPGFFGWVFGTGRYDWSHRRSVRSAVDLLLAPGNPDTQRTPSTARSEAVRLIRDAARENPGDVAQSREDVTQRLRELAARLRARDLTWTADFLVGARQTGSRATPSFDAGQVTQATLGRVTGQSDQLLRALTWSIPLAVGLGVTYWFAGPAIARVYADVKDGAKKAVRAARDAVT